MLNNLRYCYNFKLGSGCNSDKDLSKSEDDDQLVKYKDTGLHLQLYIFIDHKKIGRCIWGEKWEKHKENMRKPLLLYEENERH